jgi:hypothetical protein
VNELKNKNSRILGPAIALMLVFACFSMIPGASAETNPAVFRYYEMVLEKDGNANVIGNIMAGRDIELPDRIDLSDAAVIINEIKPDGSVNVLQALVEMVNDLGKSSDPGDDGSGITIPDVPKLPSTKDLERQVVAIVMNAIGGIDLDKIIRALETMANGPVIIEGIAEIDREEGSVTVLGKEVQHDMLKGILEWVPYNISIDPDDPLNPEWEPYPDSPLWPLEESVEEIVQRILDDPMYVVAQAQRAVDREKWAAQDINNNENPDGLDDHDGDGTPNAADSQYSPGMNPGNSVKTTTLVKEYYYTIGDIIFPLPYNVPGLRPDQTYYYVGDTVFALVDEEDIYDKVELVIVVAGNAADIAFGVAYAVLDELPPISIPDVGNVVGLVFGISENAYNTVGNVVFPLPVEVPGVAPEETYDWIGETLFGY